MPAQSKTFYLGLSMAGTVSAGTYTAGSLIELDRWLRKWSAAKKNGITLKARKDVGNIAAGSDVHFTAAEVPQHKVIISALTGASGGGVSASLYVCGLTLGNLETLVRDTWMNFDIRDMLDTDDLKGKTIWSLLNVKPIEKVIKSLSQSVWGMENLAGGIDYLDSIVELYLTLASYEGIPYNVNNVTGANQKYSVFKTHMDYMRFGFYPNPGILRKDDMNPYRYELRYRPGQALSNDFNWSKLIEAAPATGAFPIGFKSRAIKRFRKEYSGKLFYLNYASWRDGVTQDSPDYFDYQTIKPCWKDGNDDDVFDMEYFDGGAFNREPHDLARASILRKLGIQGMPHDGTNTTGAVILIDPFPAEGDDTLPGQGVKTLPDLMGQVPLLIDALMRQGRFRADWLEKSLNETYYSRFLISPAREESPGKYARLPLAGGLLGAFSGFIDIEYRQHDYHLGHYNTYKFLADHLMMREDNTQVTFAADAKGNQALLDKYAAVGWYAPETGHCQVIPRCEEPNGMNSKQPIWPTISGDKWDEVVALAEERGKRFTDVLTNFKVLDNLKDAAIWSFAAAPRFDKMAEGIAQQLRDNGLLR